MRIVGLVPVLFSIALAGCREPQASMTRQVPAGGTVRVVVGGTSPASRVRNDGPDPIRASFIANGQKFVHFDLVSGKSTDDVRLDSTKQPPVTIEILSKGKAGAKIQVSATGSGVTVKSGE